MKDMFGMLKKAQEMQKNVQVLQDELAKTEITGTSGGGLVSVVMTATHDVKKVSIKPDAVDTSDLGMLEDLLVAAFKDAVGKGNALTQTKMSAITGGLKLPGF